VPKGEFKNIVGLQNGKMHIVRAVRGNVANGARVTLLASGNMLGVQHYVDGVPNGPFIELFADGGVAQMGNKRADKKHGIWRSFDKDGRMTQEATFADGVLVNGEWEGR
jgi:antitoxin component YwqK of YwqJK toxin-antitoxin module